MKVYVITKAKPLLPEEYVSVKSSSKEAEKFIRRYFPNARKDDSNRKQIGFLCRGFFDLVLQEYGGPLGQKEEFLMFIREEEI